MYYGQRRVTWSSLSTTGFQKEIPKIVCLCGSTKFREAFTKINYEETMKGHIVLAPGCFGHSPTSEQGLCTPEQKVVLDELHKRKIDLADEVLVVDVGSYVGDSTRSEIEYAYSVGTPVTYLSFVGRV